MIGKRLAHYEILELIGKGGMGEVYRARDNKLGRDVALKILPRELSGDPERAARFEREARTLASLQHPNIASIYGYENADGVRFLSMELVEGEDLSQQLQRGALSIEETLRVARQIATGLEAAHEKNIVHRDLKPANIKIDPEGVVKILDFGLARAFVGDNEDNQLANSPTITSARTMAGVILGTASYMSPEQARGKPIDKRSDIWSFGVILFEMLTGKQMYHGETVTDVLGAIVHSTPDLESLPDNVPTGLRRLMQRCLTADAHDRLRDIGEARYALHHLDGGTNAGRDVPAGTNRMWRVASVVLLAVVLGLSGLLLLRAPHASSTVMQASVALPKNHFLVTTGAAGGSIRLAPDGQAIAFVVQEGGRRQIWVRELHERIARPVSGTEGGQRPFWSPDGQSLAFFQQGKLRRISAQGGAALTIANAPDGRGGAWFPDGTIVFAPTPGSPLSMVAAGGGQPKVITDASKSDREPRCLPDGRHFIYLESYGGGSWEMLVGSLDGTTNIEIGQSSGGVEYANGRLLYLQGRTLVAQPFDLDSFQLTGDPTPLAEDIIRDSNYGIGVFSAAGEVLAYQSGASIGTQLQWIDREGNMIGAVGERAPYTQVALSPDATTIASIIDDLDGKADIWMIDVDRGTRQRFTFTPDTDALRRGEPIWSADGSRLFYSLERADHATIYSKKTDGSGGEELLLDVPNMSVWPYHVSPDGRFLLFGLEDSTSSENLCTIPTTGGEMKPIFESPFDTWPGRFSPDGRWLAFDSDDTGRREIYIMPFPDRGGRWQASKEGGRFPRWSGDGRELYYTNLEGTMMMVRLDPSGNTPIITEAVELFQTDLGLGYFGLFDVDREHNRFLILQQPKEEAPISLFVNWMAAIEER